MREMVLVMEANEEQIRAIVREETERALRSTLLSLGIDATDPLKAQAQMASIRRMTESLSDEETQADFVHLRKWRKSMEQVSSVGMKTAIGIVVTGFFAMLVLGIKEWIGK